MDDWLGRLPARPQPLYVRLLAATAIMAGCIALQAAVAVLSALPGMFLLLAGIFICSFAFDRVAGIYAAVIATVAALVAVSRLYPGPRRPARWSCSSASALRSRMFADALRSALERARKVERDKDILFRELAHRMQNNLAVAIALLEQQSRSHAGADTRAALANAGDRLRILAEGQRHLQPLGPGLVEMRGYLAQICDHLSGSLAAGRAIEFVFRLDAVAVDADKALALALITNELVTNALKYAFVGRNKGIITVALAEGTGGEVTLTVSDDGVGSPAGAAEGFGSQLIRDLTAHHGGSVAYLGAPPGCRVQVTHAGGARTQLRRGERKETSASS